jgi:hypothetical protein
LRQTAFIDGRFHTAYLDDLLQQRAGQPFSEVDPSCEEVAALVAALEASAGAEGRLTPATTDRANAATSVRRPSSANVVPGFSRASERAPNWKARARVESLGE